MSGPLVMRMPLPESAEAWVARMRAADVTAEERKAFEAWIAADANHFDEYLKCRDMEAMTSGMREHPEFMGELSVRLAALRRKAAAQATRTPSASRMQSWLIPAALAASLAIVALVAIRPGMTTSPLPQSAATRHGEQRAIMLADGSTVQLNTETQIAWSIAGDERQVRLDRGEAYFSVAKDPNRPFIVHAGASEVRVVGTQFSVRRDGEKVDVVVREGLVKIVPDSGPLSFIQPKVELTPGNRVELKEGAREVKIAAVDADRLTSWRTGSLEFDGMTLDEVVAEVNRYSDTPLVIGDDSLRSQRISGRVRVGDIDTVRFILRERFDIESTQADGSIRLLKR